MATPPLQTPQERLVQAMSPVRLSRSLKSQACPACADLKECGKVLCGRCWSKVSHLHPMFKEQVGLGHIRPLLLAMLYLGAMEFFETLSDLPRVRGLPPPPKE